MTRFGVDVEADVHVASGQVDDEVGVVIHWVRNTELVTHEVLFTFNTAAGRVSMILWKSSEVCWYVCLCVCYLS